MSRPAVFVDRDGTLNEMLYDETHGIFDSPRLPEQVRLKSGAADFLKRLRDAGFFLCVATNQPGLARGTLTHAALDAVNARIAELLAEEGATLDAIKCCPHSPGKAGSGSCACRKPAPGMLLEAAREYGLDLASSWMVGDGLNDVQAGRATGCRTILVTSLKLEQIERFLSLKNAEPHAIAGNLAAAADIIIKARCQQL